MCMGVGPGGGRWYISLLAVSAAQGGPNCVRSSLAKRARTSSAKLLRRAQPNVSLIKCPPDFECASSGQATSHTTSQQPLGSARRAALRRRQHRALVQAAKGARCCAAGLAVRWWRSHGTREWTLLQMAYGCARQRHNNVQLEIFMLACGTRARRCTRSSCGRSC